MLSRRGFLAGALVMPAISVAAPLPVWRQLEAAAIGAIRAHLMALPAGPALLASYIVDPGAGDFGKINAAAAYTYDNALAGLALLAAGEANAAGRIADALLAAQNSDPDHADGRLRNAYRAGQVQQPAALPGWWDKPQNRWVQDPYQIGSDSGPMAWAILLWAALAAKGVNTAAYHQAARRAGQWISGNLRAPSGFYGGYFGFPPHPQKLSWVSTEQNTDLAVAFQRLGMRAEAEHAARFVRLMRGYSMRGYSMRGQHGLIAAGLTPDGKTNPMIAADANLWPRLAGLIEEHSDVIEILGWPRGRPDGIGFSEASQGIWLEGTGFAALWLRQRNHPALARHFASTILSNIAPSSYAYATVPKLLRTGLTIGPDPHSPQFDYFRIPALAPTAWAALAALAANPFISGKAGPETG